MNEVVLIQPDQLRKIVADEVNKIISDLSAQPTKEKEVFTNREAMDYLSVSRSTLQRWRNEEKLPYRQVSGKILYKRSDIDELLENAAK